MKEGVIERIREIIRHNQKKVVFVACVFLSVLFWLVTSLGRNYETSITLPVSYRNVPFSKELNKGLPGSIEYYFKGTGFELFYLHLRNQPDSVIADISGDDHSSNSAVSISSLSLSSQLKGDLSPHRALPEIIAPGLITKIGKKIPVRTSSEVDYRQRFGSERPLILVPDSIYVSGPSELLKNIHEIRTRKIILSDVHQDVFGSIYLEDPAAGKLKISDPFVYYYLPVSEFTEGEFRIKVELPPSQRNKVTLLPAEVTVKFVADMKRYINIRPSDFHVTASVPFPEMPSAIKAEIKKMPQGVRQVRVEPRMLDYLVIE